MRRIILVIFFLMLSTGYTLAEEKPAKVEKNEQVEAEKVKKPAEANDSINWIGNKLCPVSGKPVGGSPEAPMFYSDYQGYRIGFMCPVCKGKFDSANTELKDEYLQKALASPAKEKPKK